MPLSWYWKINGDLDLVTWRMLHFSGWNAIPIIFPRKRVYLGLAGAEVGHYLFLFVCIRCSHPHRVLILELRSSGRSFIKIENSTGPNTDTCGTPLTTGTFSDDCPSTSTCSVLELRKDEIHWWVVLLIP